MPQKTPTLYYDVTQLIHHNGKITGIPRVMHELAVRFRTERENVVFVSWVKEIQALCEVDLDKSLAHRGKEIFYLHGNQTAAPAATAPSRKEISSKPVTPPSQLFKKGVVKVAKKGLRGVARFQPELSEKLEYRAKLARMHRYKKANFQKGDELFIPWGEWWDANFIVKLQEWHKRDGLKLVQIIHDMGPVVVPHLSGAGGAGGSTKTFPAYCRAILPICSLVLTVSENSKKDTIEWLTANKLKVPPIEFFRLGDDIEIAHPRKTHDPAYLNSGLKGNDFILCVGTMEAKKNHMLFYYVYKLAMRRGIELPKLVMVGRKGWMVDQTLEFMTKDPEVKDKFIFLHNEGDEELSWLYDKCLFKVLPSFYEGWGIPIAESIARGVPCLSANTSSMVEVAPGFVEHFDPYSTDECLAGIERWLDPKKLQAAREKVKKYKQFSWDDSFTQVARLMKEIK